MEPILIGYLPKQTAIPDDFGASHLKRICSVSTCIAEGPPDGWIDLWLHNEHWLFQSPSTARKALMGAAASSYSTFAYRVMPLNFDNGAMRPLDVNKAPGLMSTVNAETLLPLPENFTSLGFDIVEQTENCSSFSCSPLSCNGAWEEFVTNDCCLIDSLPRAIELATIFSKGGWEPGPYRVVEVLHETLT